MTEKSLPARYTIKADAETVFRLLPEIGKLMIIGKTDDVTHERIGPVEYVERQGDALACRGAAHDSLIRIEDIATIVADTTSVMRDQVYPRIDFNDVDGRAVVSVVGFGGLEPFEKALAGLSLETLPANDKAAERKQRPEVADDDPGRLPLEAALASGQPIGIAFEKSGFSQRWTGVVPKVSLAMGFINVMDGDFHLHLPGGSVASWVSRTVEGRTELTALGKDGKGIGLTLHADDGAIFAHAGEGAE